MAPEREAALRAARDLLSHAALRWSVDQFGLPREQIVGKKYADISRGLRAGSVGLTRAPAA